MSLLVVSYPLGMKIRFFSNFKVHFCAFYTEREIKQDGRGAGLLHQKHFTGFGETIGN
jgi:hypothetical protein